MSKYYSLMTKSDFPATAVVFLQQIRRDILQSNCHNNTSICWKIQPDKRDLKMEMIQYLVKVNTNGLKRAVILSAIDENSAIKKASTLFREAELIKVERLEKSDSPNWSK